MTIERFPPPRWIATPGDLEHALAELRQAPILAVDTESNSLFVYHERICLVQFSTKTTDYLVDPLAVDIHPLGELFADSRIEKVFHAAEYDIICFRREYHFTFNHLFDTMQASRLLKKPALGLGSILEEEYGVLVDKRHQRANWGIRPLQPDLLEYARMDTHYLISLCDRRKQELEKAGLWELAQEDFARLAEPNGGILEKPTCWSVAGREQLTKPQMATLQALVEYRERVAEKIDLPVFKVIGDKALVGLARELPDTWQKLSQGGWLSEKQLRSHGQAILAVIGDGANTPIPRRKPAEKPEWSFLSRYDRLKRWRADTAGSLGLESDLILPKDVLRNIAEMKVVSPENLRDAMHSTPWRYKRFGDELLHLLLGNSHQTGEK